MYMVKDVFPFRTTVLLFILMASLIDFTNCLGFPEDTHLSELQNARLLGPGNLEATPSFSSVSETDDGITEGLQEHFGIQAGLGVSSFMDLRARYDRVTGEKYDGVFRIDILGFGLKFRLLKDRLALYFPFAFVAGERVDTSESWRVHPTLLATFPLSKGFEINPSAKMIIPFEGDRDPYYAFNLGIAFSDDVRKWAVRPEVGICTGFSGEYLVYYSIGFTLSSGLFKK